MDEVMDEPLPQHKKTRRDHICVVCWPSPAHSQEMVSSLECIACSEFITALCVNCVFVHLLTQFVRILGEGAEVKTMIVCINVITLHWNTPCMA